VSAPSSLSTFSFALAAHFLWTPTISLVIPGMSCFHLVCWRRDLLEQPIQPLAWLFVTWWVRLGVHPCASLSLEAVWQMWSKVSGISHPVPLGHSTSSTRPSSYTF
jgi:hypothetical protein